MYSAKFIAGLDKGFKFLFLWASIGIIAVGLLVLGAAGFLTYHTILALIAYIG